MNRVVSGSHTRSVSARCVPSMLLTKYECRRAPLRAAMPANGFSASVTISGPCDRYSFDTHQSQRDQYCIACTVINKSGEELLMLCIYAYVYKNSNGETHEIRAADADVDDAFDGFAGVAEPRAVAHLCAELTHLREHPVHLRHHLRVGNSTPFMLTAVPYITLERHAFSPNKAEERCLCPVLCAHRYKYYLHMRVE